MTTAESSKSSSSKTPSIDFKKPELYFNRQLSQLEFNWRVLQQARDESIPLLERLRFLCIFSTNMDEFFEIRVSGLQQKEELGASLNEPDNISPSQILKEISQRAHKLVDEQYQILNMILDEKMAAENIRFVRRNEWNSCMDSWLKQYFEDELRPIISPLALDTAQPFQRILNKSLHFDV